MIRLNTDGKCLLFNAYIEKALENIGIVFPVRDVQNPDVRFGYWDDLLRPKSCVMIHNDFHCVAMEQAVYMDNRDNLLSWINKFEDDVYKATSNYSNHVVVNITVVSEGMDLTATHIRNCTFVTRQP